MVRAQVVPSDNAKDTDELYIHVERDGARLLRCTADEGKRLMHDRRTDERVRGVLQRVVMGIAEL